MNQDQPEIRYVYAQPPTKTTNWTLAIITIASIALCMYLFFSNQFSLPKPTLEAIFKSTPAKVEAHADNATVIGALEELNKLEVLTVPITNTYESTIDRGKTLWLWENKVTQKYVVTTTIYYKQDMSKVSEYVIDWNLKTVAITFADMETHIETTNKELVGSKVDMVFADKNQLSLTPDEQVKLDKELQKQITAHTESFIPQYKDKAIKARTKAINDLVTKFGLKLITP